MNFMIYVLNVNDEMIVLIITDDLNGLLQKITPYGRSILFK